jgi:hypothetical protein
MMAMPVIASEAKQSMPRPEEWIASSLSLLAMTEGFVRGLEGSLK